MAAEAEASREARAKVCTLNIISFSRHSLHGKVHSIQHYAVMEIGTGPTDRVR
jgi:hypothetical protein